jgi:hypothetical protein
MQKIKPKIKIRAGEWYCSMDFTYGIIGYGHGPVEAYKHWERLVRL